MTDTNNSRLNLLLQIARCNEFQVYAEEKVSACDKILNAQKKHLMPSDPLFTPTPWCGHIDTAPLLFISSNPSVDPNEYSPTVHWQDAQIVDFFENRFSYERDWTSGKGNTKYLVKSQDKDNKYYSKSQKYWSEILQWATEAYLKAGKSDIQPGIDYALTEIVHCGSKKNAGVKTVRKTCTTKYMDLVLEVSGARVLVIVGVLANELFEDMYHAGLSDPMSKSEDSRKIAELNLGGTPRLVVSIPAPGSRGNRKFSSVRFTEHERLKISEFLKS